MTREMNELLDSKRWPHIYLYEIACHCRHKSCPYKTREAVLAVIDPAILDVYEELRKRLGEKPLRINSAVRCSWHNKDNKGVKYSPHVPQSIGGGLKRSYALDISIRGHFPTPTLMKDFIRKYFPKIRIGWMQYESFCHIDMAYRHSNKNREMERRWREGAEW